MEKIVLTPIEKRVLKKCANHKFDADAATAEEQEAEISLIEKAAAYEEKYDLVDERIEFSDDCNLLVWFYDKYINQNVE